MSRARIDMVISIIASYGYAALPGGVWAYPLFSDFVGGKSNTARPHGLENSKTLPDFVMGTKGTSPFIAGDLSLADLHLAPIAFYLSLTPDKDAVLDVPGLADWWSRVHTLNGYRSTQPNLG